MIVYLKPDYSLEVLDELSIWHVFNQPLSMRKPSEWFRSNCVLSVEAEEDAPFGKLPLTDASRNKILWAPPSAARFAVAPASRAIVVSSH